MTNLEKWNYFNQDLESPQAFIDWTFYYMIGAALERRVWWGEPEFNVFPNPYVVLIGPSRIGKSAPAMIMKYEIFKKFDVKNAHGEIEEIIKRGPDSITLEKLINYMHENFKTLECPSVNGETPKIYTYSSLAFMACSELGTLFKKDTEDMIRFLTEGWECRDFEKKTKTQGDDSVRNMCISLFGAATPDWIRDAIKSTLFNEGFAARTLFIYGDRKRKLKFDYHVTREQRAALESLRDHVRELTQIFGQVDVPDHVIEWCREWYERRNKPINLDRKLECYYGCKKLHLMKMAMIVHFARTCTDMTITLEDVNEALRVLNSAEILMSKALSGVGANPLSNLTAAIQTYMEEHKTALKRELTVQFWDDCPSKSITDINSALAVLVEQEILFIDKLDPNRYMLAERAIAEREKELHQRFVEQMASVNDIVNTTKVSEALVTKPQQIQSAQTVGKPLITLEL